MKDPRLTVGLATQGDKPSLLMTRNDNELLNQINPELSDLDELGYLGARAKIGELVLMMLRIAHPDVLAPYKSLMPKDETPTTPLELVSYLQNQTQIRRSPRLIQATDLVVEEYKDDPNGLKGMPILKQWPTFKAAFERLFKPDN